MLRGVRGWRILQGVSEERGGGRTARSGMNSDELYIGEISIAGYRSIRALTLELNPLTLLVGANGAGKSNVLDALAFWFEAFNQGVDGAIVRRGGIEALRFRAGPENLPIDLAVDVVFFRKGARFVGAGFTLGVREEGVWFVKEEWVSYEGEIILERTLRDIKIISKDGLGSSPVRIVAPPENALRLLFLAPAEITKPLANISIGFCFCRVLPEALRGPQIIDYSMMLRPDGSNLNQIWRRFEDYPPLKDRVLALLAYISSGIRDLRTKTLGRYQILEAIFEGEHGEVTIVDGEGLSDGTLRALMLLVAAYQPVRQRVLVVEEPETALHPHAAGLLFKALVSAPDRPQLIMSTHSPSILESGDVNVEDLRVVVWSNGETLTGPLAEEQVEEIREHLTTCAELLTEGNLKVNPTPHRSLRPEGVS